MLGTEAKKDLIKSFSTTKYDIGSIEVQCSLLTKRIISLTKHCSNYKEDYSCKRILIMLVAKRKRFLRYLSSRDFSRYKSLIKKLGLRK